MLNKQHVRPQPAGGRTPLRFGRTLLRRSPLRPADPGTIHGFTMSDTDAFDPTALERHWDRLLALLDRALNNNPVRGPEHS